MSEDVWLWAWGAGGSLVFAGATLGAKLFADPGDDTAADRRRRRLALFNFALAILTGALTAQAFGAVVQDWAAVIVPGLGKLPRPTAALIVGCAANALWPKVVRRLGGLVDAAKLPGDAP